MSYHWDFTSIWRFHDVLIKGLLGTFELAVLGVGFAMILGLLLGVARTSPFLILRSFAAIYINFFRNIPFIVQLFWMFYALPVLTGVQSNPFLAALGTLALYGGAFFAEIYRAGTQSIDRGQWDGARAIGLSYAGALRHVILPQAFRRMIPPLTTETIELAKLTTVASTIAFFDLLYAGKLVAEQDYRPIEAYTTVAVVLITLFLIISYASARLERHFGAQR